MRRKMTTHQRDILMSDYLRIGYRNIVSIHVHSDGVVQVTSQHGLYVYHDAILPSGEIKLDERWN